MAKSKREDIENRLGEIDVRHDAIKYLKKKGELNIEDATFPKEIEKKISRVMKEGKIYGDPVVILKG